MTSPTAQSAIADSVQACKPLALRYLAGFTDDNRTRQAPGLPNPVAWSLGHCALTLHRTAEKIDGQPLPPAHFAAAADKTRYSTESVAFGSMPADNPALYPTMARCIEIYEAACDRVAAAVRAAPDSKLAQTTKWGTGETTLGALASRMVFHNGTHIGQIADLRRALGFKSIFS